MPQSIFVFLRRVWPVALGVALALIVVACGSATVSVQGSSGTSSPNQVQTFTDSATLNWTPVTQDTNGAVLTDLAGYEISYGTSASAMETRVQLPDPTQTTYRITNLAPGTWYFAVAAYTIDGTQGVLSNVASKTID
ncbi:MAG: fibronectin type III domain-containing protein [Proteobacteria bacterium]|nr:fibronectin type III domain-containing protein [Pseudomonadota bacterium]